MEKLHSDGSGFRASHSHAHTTGKASLVHLSRASHLPFYSVADIITISLPPHHSSAVAELFWGLTIILTVPSHVHTDSRQ